MRVETGTPDILVLNPNARSIVVECKPVRAGETAFPMNRIEDEQRKWLDKWEADGGLGYLGLGIIVHSGSRHSLSVLSVIPWDVWKRVEQTFRGSRVSVPMKNNKDVNALLSAFRMERRQGEWYLCKGHPILDIPGVKEREQRT